MLNVLLALEDGKNWQRKVPVTYRIAVSPCPRYPACHFRDSTLWGECRKHLRILIAPVTFASWNFRDHPVLSVAVKKLLSESHSYHSCAPTDLTSKNEPRNPSRNKPTRTLPASRLLVNLLFQMVSLS